MCVFVCLCPMCLFAPVSSFFVCMCVHRCRLSFEMNFNEKLSLLLVCFLHPSMKVFDEPLDARRRGNFCDDLCS